MAFFGRGGNDTKRLEAQLRSNEQQIRQFESALHKSKSDLEHMEADRDRLKQELRISKEKCDALAMKAGKHPVELKQKEEALQALQKQMTKFKQDKTEAEIQLREANTRQADTIARLDASTDNVKKLEQEKDHLRYSCQDMEQRMATLRSEHTTEIGQASKKSRRGKRGSDDGQEMHAAVKIQGMSPNTVTRKLNLADQITTKLGDSKAENAQLVQENGAMRKKLAQMSDNAAKMIGLENEVQALQKKLQGYGSRHSHTVELKRQIGKLEAENADCKSQFADMSKEIERLGNVEAEAKSLRERCEVSDQILADLEGARKTAKAKGDDLSDLQQRMAILSDENQLLQEQLTESRDALEKATAAIQAKENLLLAERAFIAEERNRRIEVLKEVKECQLEISRLTQEFKALSEKDKRSSCVIDALETRVETLKLEKDEIESKLMTCSKELSASQSEALGLHVKCRQHLSELFDANSKIKKLKVANQELENAKSIPNLAISQADLDEMEHDFTEEKRLLLIELNSEKSAHEQTKQQLKDAELQQDRAPTPELNDVGTSPIRLPEVIDISTPTSTASRGQKRKGFDSAAVSIPSAPAKYLRSTLSQTVSDTSPAKPFTTGRIPKIFSYEDNSHKNNKEEKKVSDRTFSTPLSGSMDTDILLLKSTSPIRDEHGLSMPLATPSDDKTTEGSQTSGSWASSDGSLSKTVSIPSTHRRRPSSRKRASGNPCSKTPMAANKALKASGVELASGTSVHQPNAAAVSVGGSVGCDVTEQKENRTSPSLGDEEEYDFYSAEGGSSPKECEENVQPLDSVSFGASGKIKAADSKRSSPLSATNVCVNSPAKSGSKNI